MPRRGLIIFNNLNAEKSGELSANRHFSTVKQIFCILGPIGKTGMEQEVSMHFSPSILAAPRQSLIVNQQLQQAITFLQMSNSELQAFMESQADENPFIRLKRHSDPVARHPSGVRSASGQDWDRIGALADTSGPSLYAHIAAQIAALDLDCSEYVLAELFLESLAPSGWLDAPLTEIALRAGVNPCIAEAMLLRLQKFEPTGVFARDLSECLRLQAAERGLLSPAFEKLLEHLPMLAAAELPALCRVCGTDMDGLRGMLRELRSFNPKPGAEFEQGELPLRAPDLLVDALAQGGWRLELNNSTLPAITVRETDMAKKPKAAAADYIAERLSVARWLSRAVQYRNQTVLRIGEEILRSQSAFFRNGPDHLRPMILKDVAEAVGVHESTVSRVSNAVTMATPFGVMALKRFFSAALPGQDGEADSAEAIRARIKRMIQSEPVGRPFSDETLVHMLGKEGVSVARRTVAKYREQLRIPTSALRRRQAILSAQ